MYQKLVKFVFNFFNHIEWIWYLLLSSIPLFVALAISPDSPALHVITFFFFLFWFGSLIIYSIEEIKEKKKRKNWEAKDYAQKHAYYISLVNSIAKEKQYTIHTEEDKWIRMFDKCINGILPRGSMRDELDDFDIASCLIYAFLLAHNCNDEELAFIFECAKHIISTPKSYIKHILVSGDFELETFETFESVTICVPNDEFSLDTILQILKAYGSDLTWEGILALSDFLHTLYLISK